MIPISLSIQGLYSYKEAQTIDFTSLISSGLFGIFGTVGSGKSSILEAIMFVLYDKSDRLNYAGDNRYYNMLNLQSDELMLDFTFSAGPNNTHTYRFRFVARRNKKDYEKVEVKEKTFYQLVDGEWLPLENIKDASSILGMSYENFMQTIIIPQGKFREFVDHSAGERTKMLKELFHLNKYDLSQKTNILLKKNELNISNIEGRLQELGIVDGEAITAKAEALEEVKEALQTADLQCKASKAEEEKLKMLKNVFTQIARLEDEKMALESQADVYAEKGQHLRIYEKAFTYLREKIQSWETNSKELEEGKVKLDILTEKTAKNQQALTAYAEAYRTVKSAYDARHQISQKCEDLENIIRLKQVQDDLIVLQQKVIAQAQQNKKTREALDQIKADISAAENTLMSLETAMPDATMLQQAYHWHIRKQDLQQVVDKHRQQAAKFQIRSQEIELEKSSLYGRDVITFEEIIILLKDDTEKAAAKKEVILQEIHTLKVQQELVEITSGLKDNEPCPVCGALDHPRTSHPVSPTDQITVKQSELAQVEQQLKQTETTSSRVRQLAMDHRNQQNLMAEKQAEIEEAVHIFAIHTQQHPVARYAGTSLEELSRLKTAAEAQQQTILATKKTLKQLKEGQEKKDQYLQNVAGILHTAERDMSAIEATKVTLIKQLKQLSYEKFENFDLSKLEENLAKGKRQLQEIELQYDAANANLQQARQEEQMLKGQLQSEESYMRQQQRKIAALDAEIKQLLLEHGFSDMQQVKRILATVLNLEQERRQLEQYHRQLHSTTTALKNVYQEAEGRTYDAKKHQELIAELEHIDALMEELRKQAALQNKEIEDLKNTLTIRQDCEAQLENLKQREHNLKDLRKLFMGNGFVRYVSTIYLQDLCKAANKRFFKLTNNNLSLELNHDEEFIVRDFLNNGKTRLLKTLSGGQTFQAALCLALALAENVKSINKADKSFFFLDEGFGALDKESLRIVFETLKSLRKENRIVGIISHVEELQQEIDVYLNITNDKETGSQVSYSWK